MAKSANKAGRLAVAKTYKIYIGGKFPRTESARYYTLEDKQGNVIANVCRGSRKDFRNAMCIPCSSSCCISYHVGARLHLIRYWMR